MTQTKPKCTKCGAAGDGVQFLMFSKYGFGTYCIVCEDEIDAWRGICPNCAQTQRGPSRDCFNECKKRGFAP